MTLDKQQNDDGGVSPIHFLLDPGSGVPTYLQLVHQVEQALRVGVLHDGDQLPRIKDVVASLAINPNTVLKAYRELTQRGLASSRPGVGSFVQGGLPVVDLAEQATLRKSLVRWVRSARTAGLDHAGIAALMTSVINEEAPQGGATRAADARARGVA